MGIRFSCPNGHKLHVKNFLAGKRGVCPQCGTKILIPPADESASTNGSPHAESVPPPRVGSSAQIESMSAVASPSAVIALADVPPTIQIPDQSVRPPQQVTSQPTTATPPLSPLPSIVATGVAIEESSSSRYVAHRERARRNQVSVAILLLMAVIVLAIVLIVVLQRGVGNVPVEEAGSVRLPQAWPAPYVSVASDKSSAILCSAHRAALT